MSECAICGQKVILKKVMVRGFKYVCYDCVKAAGHNPFLWLGNMKTTVPELSLLYYVPDARKAGGAYVTVSGRIKKITDFPRCIYLTDGSRIPIEDIVAVESPCLRENMD